MLNRRSLIKSIALLPPALALEAESVLAQALGAPPKVNQPVVTPKMRIPMGVAFNDFFNQSSPAYEVYRQTIVKYFDEITDGNAMGIDNNQKSKGQYNFGRADKFVEFGRQNNLKMKSCNLIWEGSTPQWVKNITSPIELEKVMRGHIEVMMQRYGNSIYNWVVVNEPVSEKPLSNNDNRKNIYQTILGERYMYDSFRTARAINPKTKLIINEYDVESYLPAHRLRLENFKRIIFTMLDKGVPLDGVGLQAHLDPNLAINREDLGRFLEEIKKAKLEVYVTELDVRDATVKGNNEMRDIVVASKTYEFLNAVFDVHRPTSVTAWGVHDTDTWLRVWWKRPDGQPLRPLPFDANYQPKLMYRVLEQFCRGLV